MVTAAGCRPGANGVCERLYKPYVHCECGQVCRPPVDIAFWVRYDDGEPAANLDLELHSTVRDGRTDEQGWEEIHDVEMGMHTVYVKQQGKVLCQQEFRPVP